MPTGKRPTRLIVDLGVVETNAAIIREQISPSTKLMAVVKANGYGHGAVAVARAALAGGASFLGVATVTEALEIRESHIDSPILVLGSSDPTEASLAAAHGIAIAVGDLVQAKRLLDVIATDPPRHPLHIHLKVDTGMRRFGVGPEEALDIARHISNGSGVRLAGVYSHFAEADAASTERMDRQLRVFRETLGSLSEAGIDPGIAHISNSAALLRNRSADFDMVRAGICLYGIAPSAYASLFDGVAQVLEWRATVQHVTQLAPGDRTGYGGTYVATEHERLALLPIGYADGYPRQLSNVGWVSFQGTQLPIRGFVSMDQCTAGIPSGVQIDVGDEVTIIGCPRNGAPNANLLGDLIGTVGYEIVSRISTRVPVEYI